MLDFVAFIKALDASTDQLLPVIGCYQPQCRQIPGTDWNQDIANAQFLTQIACMHWPGTTKRHQREIRRISATLDGDGPYGTGHAHHRQPNDTLRKHFHLKAKPLRE